MLLDIFVYGIDPSAYLVNNLAKEFIRSAAGITCAEELQNQYCVVVAVTVALIVDLFQQIKQRVICAG